MLSDQNRIKQEVSNIKTKGKSPNTWKLNNTLLSNLWVKVELLKENLKYTEMN